MIKGIGIDAVEIDRIKQAMDNPRFVERILTPNEINWMAEMNAERQAEFLAGRFAVKEAFSKAWGTGIGEVSFQDIEVLANENGAPCFSKSPHGGASHLSITHTREVATAIVVLEADNRKD